MQAKADEKERIRLEQWAERQARLQRAVERSGNLVTETEERVRELLLDGDFNEVADYLLVTVSTLTRWTRDPCRKEWWRELNQDRGTVDAYAVKTTGRDDTREAAHKAIAMTGQTWGAKTMNRETFGASPEIVAVPVPPPQNELEMARRIAYALAQGVRAQEREIGPTAPKLPPDVEEDGGKWE